MTYPTCADCGGELAPIDDLVLVGGEIVEERIWICPICDFVYIEEDDE